MTNDEAESLARELRAPDNWTGVTNIPVERLRGLCDYILSGSMKREIENAAFERAAQIVMSCQSSKLCTNATVIRSLIQPPAQQKENGE